MLRRPRRHGPGFRPPIIRLCEHVGTARSPRHGVLRHPAADAREDSLNEDDVQRDDDPVSARDVDHVGGLSGRAADVDAPRRLLAELLLRVNRHRVCEAAENTHVGDLRLGSLEAQVRCLVDGVAERDDGVDLGGV